MGSCMSVEVEKVKTPAATLPSAKSVKNALPKSSSTTHLNSPANGKANAKPEARIKGGSVAAATDDGVAAAEPDQQKQQEKQQQKRTPSRSPEASNHPASAPGTPQRRKLLGPPGAPPGTPPNAACSPDLSPLRPGSRPPAVPKSLSGSGDVAGTASPSRFRKLSSQATSSNKERKGSSLFPHSSSVSSIEGKGKQAFPSRSPSVSRPQQQVVEFTAEELRVATDGFSHKLGEGGFGCVYRGVLDAALLPGLPLRPEGGGVGGGEESEKEGGSPCRKVDVAVKVLNEKGFQGHKEWLAELQVLSTLRHQNLVCLLGWTAERNTRMLVYELVPNGSLDVLLHGDLARSSSCEDLSRAAEADGGDDATLPWGLRMRIALGVARCLTYLHEEVQPAVIYRDVKAANVLLDKDWNPKLADFGLAKSGPVGDKTHVTTQVVGTHGYADPDYILTGHLTPKSDVYGFGVLLLELITGRPAMTVRADTETTHSLSDMHTGEGPTSVLRGDIDNNDDDEDKHDLVKWVQPYLKDKKRLHEILDPKLLALSPPSSSSPFSSSLSGDGGGGDGSLGKYGAGGGGLTSCVSGAPPRALIRVAVLSQHCINGSPYERPQMSSVVKTLQTIQCGYMWRGETWKP